MNILVAIYGFICILVGADIIYIKIARGEISLVSRHLVVSLALVIGLVVTLVGLAVTAWGMSNIFLDLPASFKIVNL